LSALFQAADDATPPGEHAALHLAPFLDPQEFTAVALVHGEEDPAPTVYADNEPRLSEDTGLLWVDDPDLLQHLSGNGADTMKTAFAPDGEKLLTFFSPLTKRTNWSLEWHESDLAGFDGGINKARLDQ